MANWFVAAKRADFEKIAGTFGISPVLARIIRNRNLIREDEIRKYLYGTPADFYDASLMKDLGKAVQILQAKIEQGRRIRIIGDYDVDGICATRILQKGLSLCKASVDCVIPHRIHDGYGINVQLVKDALEEGVDTLITCDNGVAATEAFRIAKEGGLTCIITDHHEIPFEMVENKKCYCLPQVDALVNPKQEDCSYPNKNICGAGVAWKLIEKMWEGQTVKEEAHREILELAAIATVCDVMVLLDENRILVKEGLKSMRNASNQGIRALLKVNDIDTEMLTAHHLGFVIGPSLNAAGRLDTALRGLELLQQEQEREAIYQADELKQLNESRKAMTEEGVREAIRLAREKGWDRETVMVVYLPDCHESLAGIIAGRLKEKYYRPVFVLTDCEEGVKGSGRSIEGYHMYEEMNRCRELFIRFGGHKMAAGLTMEKDKMERFRRTMNENCSLSEEELNEKVLIDVPLPMAKVSYHFLEELKLLEPFGTGNEKPVFAQKNLRIRSISLMGKNRDMARFSVEDEEKNRFRIVQFRNWEKFRKDMGERYGIRETEQFLEGKRELDCCIHAIYYPGINSFRGRKEIQFILQNWSFL